MPLYRETTVHFLSSAVRSVAGFVATLVIARLLGSEALGIYALALAILFWIEIPSSGFGAAITKRISEGEDESTYFATGLAINIGLFAVIALMMFIGRTPLNNYFRKNLTLLVILLFLGQVVFGTTLAGLRGQSKVGLSGIVQTIERIVRTAFQVLLILLGYAVAGLVFGHAVSLLIGVGVGLSYYSFGFSRPSLDHLFDLYEYAKYAWVAQVQGKAYGWLDTVLLGFFVTTSLIGIYEVAWSLAATLVLVNKSIIQSLFPEVSKLGEEGDHEGVRNHIEEALAFAGIIMLPGLFGAVVIGSRVLKIYNTEFVAGATVLLILIFARIISSIGKMFSSTIYALDRPELAFRIDVPILFANLILNIILISQIGWHGAAIATALTAVINLGLSHIVLRRIIGRISIPWGMIARQLVASLVMAVLIWLIEPYVSESHYATLILVFSGAGVYTAVLWGISRRFRRKLSVVTRSFV